MIYHAYLNNEIHGPFSLEQLMSIAKSGVLTPESMVYPEGGADWVTANTIEGLFNKAVEKEDIRKGSNGVVKDKHYERVSEPDFLGIKRLPEIVPFSGTEDAITLIYDTAVNYAFQQNAIPVVKELSFRNDAVKRKNLTIRVTTEPAFATAFEIRLESIDSNEVFRMSPLDLKLGHDYLSELRERVQGWLKIEVLESETVHYTKSLPISVLAENEWSGLTSLPEILSAFVLPNDPTVMKILGRASEILHEFTKRSAFNGYQDKNRNRAREQIAAIYKAIGELKIRYIVASASFEASGQKIRFPSDIWTQRFGNCLDLSLLFSACCEQIGLHPLVIMHQGHAYVGCWLEERTLPDSSEDDLQHIRKLTESNQITVFESTLVAGDKPGILDDAELVAREYLQTTKPFHLALDIKRSRIARIRPLPIPGQVEKTNPSDLFSGEKFGANVLVKREIEEDNKVIIVKTEPTPTTRIDLWKSKLLDLTLRNKLLNFKETKTSIKILSATPEHVEDELALEKELQLLPKPKLMSEDDPRDGKTYTRQQREDALHEHLREELVKGRLHTELEASEHSRRLTELFRAFRMALDENGSNSLYLAVGILEWREAEHSDRVLRAPILLVPVELIRKSVLEGFSLSRMDEDASLNVTLMEKLRQDFQKEIIGLDPLPEDDNGVDVRRVFQVFRDAVRDFKGWEVKTEIWLGQFSFTKFLLWKDLTSRVEELTQNRIVHHLVNTAGTTYPNIGEDVSPRRLDDDYHPRDIFCPRSADSSQLAAVIAADLGHDFVLEGPPGTGKSQTITNIIAHCLSKGKRVLFVAEKRAALDVVQRRLREDGLEPFCLELHSNKTGKSEVLAQFDKALKFSSMNPSSEWENRAEELQKLKEALNNYSRSLHHKYPCGLSTFDCLDYLLPRKDETVLNINWTSVLGVSFEKLEQSRQLMQLVQKRAEMLMPLKTHPLSLIEREDWTPSWAEQTLGRIVGCIENVQNTIIASQPLKAWLEFASSGSHKEMLALCSLTECLCEAYPVNGEFISSPWNRTRQSLENWISLVEKRVETRNKLKPIHLSQADASHKLICEGWTANQAEEVFRTGTELLKTVKSGLPIAVEFCQLLKAPSLSLQDIYNLIGLADSLLNSQPVSEAFILSSWASWNHELENWIACIEERQHIRKQLSGYNEQKLLALNLDELNQKWSIAQSSWFLMKWIHIGGVRRRLRTACSDNSKPDVSTLSDVINFALRLKELNSMLLEASGMASNHLGILWNEGEPQFEALRKVRDWGAVLHQNIENCEESGSHWNTHLREVLADYFKNNRASFSSGSKTANCLKRYSDLFGNYIEVFNSYVSQASILYDALVASDDHLAYVTLALETYLKEFLALRTLNEKLGKDADFAQSCLGTLWNQGEPDVDVLHRLIIWGENLQTATRDLASGNSNYAQKLRQMLSAIADEGTAFFDQDSLNLYQNFYKQYDESWQTLCKELQIRSDCLDASRDHFKAILTLTESFKAEWSHIRYWCAWRKSCKEAENAELSNFIEVIELSKNSHFNLLELFERSFRRAILFAAIECQPALKDFFGKEHENLIERFGRLDDQHAHLASEIVRARLSSHIPSEHNVNDLPKTEIGLLRKEIAKKTRHIPVRKLLSGIPHLLPRLKPCVLMSPLSVAQYLEPSHENFDIVIFDEASQIPVWDAVGAIARGKQLIVVGDPKQLPPTRFFAKNDDDEDDSFDEQKDLESILDELMSVGMRHKRLRWHYRSRHESLIAFSNRQYYNNDLITFPSPEQISGGVQFKYQEKARCDKGNSRTNKVEAMALVDDLVSRLKSVEGSNRSYGVVTFSQAQQKMVEDLLDQKRREFPEIERHFGSNPPVEGEAVFVKNLESVQGDERDVIYFSICYGPDESGKVSMHFGPLNNEGGERRLNVAITRAKHEVLVFSCLRADHIDLTRTKARGVRDLKYFLDYAERGRQALASATSASADAKADSEFEKMVAERIRKEGYEVHHQVGCSDYRIDLAIVDPQANGRYLLGVECDGATYHRSATARDRDKLRQLILEGLGWKIHRIWSTDWWHDPDKEIQKLLNRIRQVQTSR